jgi:hypothetical protein
MAKAKDLAGLAALGALAYRMRNKGEAPKGKEDTGPGYKSTETRLESPEETIKRSMKKAPLDDTEKYPSGVMGGARQKDSKVRTSNLSADNTKSAAVPSDVVSVSRQVGNDSRNAEAGMSRGTRRDIGKEAANKTDAMRNASRETFRQSLKFADEI